MKKYVMLLFQSYFWIYTIDALLGFIVGVHYLHSILLPLIYLFLAVNSPNSKKKFICDIFIILILVFDSISWLINDYPFKWTLVFRHFMGSIAYMSCYLIGRNYKREYYYSIFYKSYLPLAIVSIIGIYCFFYNPAWYMKVLLEASVDGNVTMEALRLRSIFPSPYTISYMCAFLTIFTICAWGKGMFNSLTSRNRAVLLLMVALFLITMVFCMMRAPLINVFVSVFISVFYLAVVKRKILPLVYVFSFCFISIISFFIILDSVESSTRDFMLQKIEYTQEKDFVEERYNLTEVEESLLGDGAGRHDFWADDYVPNSSKRDGEYQKIKQEVGLIGHAVYLGMLIFVLFKCLFNVRHLTFELCIVIFLITSMIGANPLSTPDKHPCLFWLVIGYVASFNRKSLKDEYNTATFSNRCFS